MNWNHFRKYSERMTRVERSIIKRRVHEWFDGHSDFDEDKMSIQELAIAFSLFEAGWISARIETSEDPILRN